MADIEKVKKGLACCTNMDRCFGKCPYDDEYDDVVDCTSELAKDALEAIEEQQAEIERLNALLKEQDAEIRQLRLALDIAKGTCKGIKSGGGQFADMPTMQSAT